MYFVNKHHYVFGKREGTHAVSENGENIVVSADNENGIYVVENPSDEIRYNLPHQYSSDVNSIRSIPSQRSLIVNQLYPLLGAIEGMIEGTDLRQEAPIF